MEETQVWNHVLLPNSDSSSSLLPSLSADSLLDDLLYNTETCTHTHTCSPEGPRAEHHTHTCHHTHTHVIPSVEDGDKSTLSKCHRPLGNREAVRKYREKRKAHTAYLEEEVKKLRLLNQQLMRKLQRQDVLRTQVLRLRALLLELTGKLNKELGDKSMNGY